MLRPEMLQGTIATVEFEVVLHHILDSSVSQS